MNERKRALNLDENNRILSATFEEFASDGMPIVDSLPSGDTEEKNNITNYIYYNGDYIYDPIPQPEPKEPVDRLGQLEADVMYLSMMTGVDIPTLEV